MREKLFTYVRWAMVSLTSIVMLILIGYGAQELLISNTFLDDEVQGPSVKFSDYEAYKNVDLTKKDNETEKYKKMFQEVFFDSSQEILANVSTYALTTGQSEVNKDKFEEYLFKSVSAYDYKVKISYIKQLATQTEDLVDYATTFKDDKTKNVIVWTSFLDWFSYDFDEQLNAQKVSGFEVLEESQYSKIESIIMALLVLILFTMMLLLIKIEENTQVCDTLCCEISEEENDDVEVSDEAFENSEESVEDKKV